MPLIERNVPSCTGSPGSFFGPGIGKAFLVIVAFLPAMALLADIQRFAVNVPFMDD
jgi:hypothetical protein